jgi:hypothetical protein
MTGPDRRGMFFFFLEPITLWMTESDSLALMETMSRFSPYCGRKLPIPALCMATQGRGTKRCSHQVLICLKTKWKHFAERWRTRISVKLLVARAQVPIIEATLILLATNVSDYILTPRDYYHVIAINKPISKPL